MTIRELLQKHIDDSNSFRDEVKSELSNIKSSMTRINFVLVGDPQTETDGLASKVAKHDKYIHNDRKFKWTVAGIMTGGMGGGLTALWAYIKSKFGG